MGNKIFSEILFQKIHEFENTFSEQAPAIFNSPEGLIHPGEYGRYREESTKQILRMLLDSNYAIGDGFVITANDHISTQCDIVVYNANTEALLKDNLIKFYPIEEVYSIGEVKSTLDKSRFKEALIKLAHNKMLASERPNDVDRKSVANIIKEYDSICTFLICYDVNFEMDSIDFKELYGDIDPLYWHNAILILNEGCYFYAIDPDKQEMKDALIRPYFKHTDLWPFPLHIENENRFNVLAAIQKNDDANDKYQVICLFFRIISLAIMKCVKHEFHFTNYISEILNTFYIQNNEDIQIEP